MSSASVTLSWQPPSLEQRNGIIENYKICIRKFSPSPGLCEMMVWAGNDTKSTVTNLKPYTTYNFRISAATVAGVGPSVLLVNKTSQAGWYTFFYYMVVNHINKLNRLGQIRDIYMHGEILENVPSRKTSRPGKRPVPANVPSRKTSRPGKRPVPENRPASHLNRPILS